MKRFAILPALAAFCALTATPLMAETCTGNDCPRAPVTAESPAALEKSATKKPCDTFDCSKLPAPLEKAVRNIPGSWTKAMDNVKTMLNASCDGDKCTFELPGKK